MSVYVVMCLNDIMEIFEKYSDAEDYVLDMIFEDLSINGDEEEFDELEIRQELRNKGQYEDICILNYTVK